MRDKNALLEQQRKKLIVEKHLHMNIKLDSKLDNFQSLSVTYRIFVCYSDETREAAALEGGPSQQLVPGRIKVRREKRQGAITAPGRKGGKAGREKALEKDDGNRRTMKITNHKSLLVRKTLQITNQHNK